MNNSFLAKHALESATVAELVDEVEVVWGFQHVDILNDVLVLFYVGEDVDFINCAFLKLLVFLEAPHLDHLNRILLVVILVNRPIHLTICSLPDYLVQRVVLDYPHHYFAY